MNLDSERLLKPHIPSGEKILWAGKPAQGILFSKEDKFMIPFSIFWGGVASLFFSTALRAAFKNNFSPESLFLLFVGTIFFITGLYLMGGRFFRDKKVRKFTSYCLTEKRAIILTGWRRKNVINIPFDRIDDIEYQEEKQGLGNIIFNVFSPNSGIDIKDEKGEPIKSTEVMPPAFRFIENPVAVYNLILKYQKRK